MDGKHIFFDNIRLIGKHCFNAHPLEFARLRGVVDGVNKGGIVLVNCGADDFWGD